jgi:hypothetical protein
VCQENLLAENSLGPALSDSPQAIDIIVVDTIGFEPTTFTIKLMKAGATSGKES